MLEDPTAKQWRILVVGALVVLLIDFGGFLSIPAQTEIFQDIICRHYYATYSVVPEADGDCKVAFVQSELAAVNGWKDTFDALPSILVAVPFGVLADRVGRKPCVLLCFIGFFLGEAWARLVCWWPEAFPLRAVWVSGVFRMIGGGDVVATSMVCVMVADAFPEESRATALFRLYSVAILADVLATPLGATLMTLKSAWVPYLLGFGVATLGLLIGLLLPETLERSSEAGATRQEDASSNSKNGVREIYGRIRGFLQSTLFMWRSWNIMLGLLMFLITSLSRQATALFLQYSSAKFHWTIAHASLLLSVRGTVTLANFLLVMPALSSVLTDRLRMSSMTKDRRMCQATGLISILGFMIMFLAAAPAAYIAGLVLASLGAAFAINARSLVTSLVSQDQVGRLYSAAATVQSIGIIVAGPLFAALFSWGLELGWSWLGLPFLLAALLYVIATVAVSSVSMNSAHLPGDGSDEEREGLLDSESGTAT